MSELVDEYNRIADNTLDKVFVLKNKTYKQIDIENVDELLSEVQTELEKCKERVSKKCRDYGVNLWHKHTMLTHPVKGLNRELLSDFSTLRPTISQAYIKFGEILEKYPQLTESYESLSSHSLRTLHLAEAPGCFVQALADFLPEKSRAKWLWRANSLMPYHEAADLSNMLIDDSFMAAYIDNFLPGPDSTGNIMNFNDDYIASFLGETGKFQLITCDGSFDCTDNPGNQEASVFPLIMQSFKITMKCLQKGGSAVLKIYTLFSEDMLSFLNHFCPMFERIICHKPSASKPGNGEIYLIGINFREIDLIEPISNDLRFAVYEAARFFAKHQIDAINFNLASFNKLNQYQKSAIEIKKREIKAIVKSRLNFIQTSVLSKPTLRELELNNYWQENAWNTLKIKCQDYEHYRTKVYNGPINFPINFNPEWPLDLLNCFTMTPESMNSIIRNNKYLTLSLRSLRPHQLDAANRIQCSLFADYKLLELAQDMGVNYYDMATNRRNQIYPQLRYHFSLRDSQMLIDSAFMSRTDWLELCYYVATREITVKNIFSATRLAVLLAKPVDNLVVDSVRIFMSTSSLILSRFSASIIHFLSLFFEQVSINDKGIEFNNRIKVSDELAEYAKKLTDIPSTFDLVQFVPLKFFTNKSIYFNLLNFNNQTLHDLLQKETIRRNQMDETG